jgi:DNA modification methylase
MTKPNQDITAFIAEHGTPYDAATDTYRRAPFAEPIKAGKNTAIYNAHSYHTKVPPQGIVPYIEHYTVPGDLVLDPFCGSGMTGVAALMSGRNAILNDLSPAAIHIARNYCTPVDVAALQREFDRIKAAVAEEFEWLYGTTCERCGGEATIQYTIWSDVFQCRRCTDEMVLWNVGYDEQLGKVSDAMICPKCGLSQKKIGLKRLPEIPVRTTCRCRQCEFPTEYHLPRFDELQRISEIGQESVPYWTPSTEFDPKGPQYQRNALGNRKIRRITDLFTKRNLRALARLWHESNLCNDDRMRSALQFSLTAIMQRASRLNRLRPSGAGDPMTGTIYIGSLTREDNVLELWSRKFDGITRALSWSNNRQAFVTNSSATQLELPDESVDYIFTDPPFGSNIYYSEVNLLWEAWLGKKTETQNEAVVHRHQDRGTKQITDYSVLMASAFCEMYRVLKPGRWSSVVFHNSDDQIWQCILDAVESAGFELADINAFDKEQLSFKGIRGQKGLERVTNKDLVLNLRKPAPGQQTTTNGTIYADEQERRVVEAIADFLDNNPPAEDRTLQGIWNHALDRMLREGSVQVNMAAVGEMLPHYFKAVDGRWYLRGEAVFGGNVFDLNHDGGALAWLHSMLGNEPQTTGELIPRWQAATAHLGASDPGRLDRLLHENFWEDKRSGRWRIPTNEERTKMSARQSLPTRRICARCAATGRQAGRTGQRLEALRMGALLLQARSLR